MRIIRSLGDVAAALVARVRGALVPRNKFRMVVHSSGQCYLPSLDNTTEVLAVAEGEWFK